MFHDNSTVLLTDFMRNHFSLRLIGIYTGWKVNRLIRQINQ